MEDLNDRGQGLLRPAEQQPHTDHCRTNHDPDNVSHSSVPTRSCPSMTTAPRTTVGRRWPTNLDTDPRVTAVVLAQDNPYDYVEIRGTARRATDGADEQIDRLAKKYLGQDQYPFRTEGEQRVRYVLMADRVRHQKQR